MLAGLCDARQEQTCREEVGENLAWTCAQCEKKKARDIHPYTRKMLWLRRLRAAGYPFRRCDLTMEEWEDLARLEDMIRTQDMVRQTDLLQTAVRQMIGR